MTPKQAQRQAERHAAATLAAYERWAPTYPPFAHNPLMRAEEAAMRRHWPQLAGGRALDLACGTGRYAKLLAQGGADPVVALDFSAAMLRQVSCGTPVRASMMKLPFVSDSFEAVICGLASGHAAELHPWMLEIARVLQPGGALLYSDFHADAVHVGLKRSFEDEFGRKSTLPHRCYSLAEQTLSVAAAGLTLEAVEEVRIGIELTEAFEGSAPFYGRWHRVPLVLVVRARK